MPLVRYEIRNEYSLANPDLYRAAAKDDPEGLLEGVAMAGLVGIVRQLGDLAEFAAEVFHDLHEEILATAARGHELTIRVQQLESELPLIEKMMFSETKSNHDTFIYSQGIVWHPELRNDQNHFTQGDLPHFIRNAYEECRGPPRLFLLDKFDVAGAGACLKRYTDPFFFKMEWASTELMKAEKEQQDRKARRIRKKRQAVELGSRASDNFGLRPSEDGSRIVKVHNGTIMQRQAGDISSLKSKIVSERSSKNVSMTSKDGYSEPVIERQAMDGNSLTSENVALKTSKADSRMLKDACIDPVKERQAVDTSPRTSENVILRTLEDDSEMLKDTYSVPVMQGPATDISLMNSEKVVMRKTEDSSNMLKDDYSTPVMQREVVDIGSSTSDNDDLKPMENGSRILKDALTTTVMQRQDSSSTSESVDLKTTEDDHPRMLKDDYVGSAMPRQNTDIGLVESKYASSKMPEDVLKTPGDDVLMAPVASTRRTSEHTSLKMAGDAGKESLTKMSEDADTESSTKLSEDDTERMSDDTSVRMLEDAALRISEDTVPRMCEDIAQNISEEAAVRMSDVAPRTGEDEVQKMSEDAVPRMSEDAVQNILHDAGLRTSEGPGLRMSTDHVFRTSDDDILRAIEVTDDFASETENFVDALATMDSEVETDNEMKAKFEDEDGDYFVASSKISSNNLADTNLETAMVNKETLDNDCKNEEQGEEKQSTSIKFSPDSPERDLSNEVSTLEDHQKDMMNMPDKENAIDKIHLAQQVSRSDIDGDVQSTMERIDLTQQVNELNMDGNVHDNYSDSLKENEWQEGIDQSPRHTNGFIDAYPSPKRDCDVFKPDDHDESESIENIPETPEDSETDDDGSLETENLSELPMSTGALGDGSRDKFSKWHGSRSADRVLQSTSDAFYRGLSDLSFEDSESELSDSVKETSPRSSANSSIRPIKWVSKSHDSSSGSNDEMDDTQVSSASSSTLSSPRPSTLATTVFSVDSENPKCTLSPERPMKNSLVSHLSESPKSVASTESELGTRDVSPEVTAEKPTETLNSEPVVGSPAEQLESPSSEILGSRASEHVIFDPRTMTSTSGTVLGVTAETLKYTSEAFIFPSVEPLRSLSELSITKSAESTAGLASQSMVMNSNLSTESSLPFQAKYTGSPQFLNVELEQFPPPPPLPPLQWRMSRRLQKNTSLAYKEAESQSVAAPENAPTDSDITLKDFNSSANESPALQMLESTRWPAENLNLHHAPVMVNEESQPVSRTSLDLQKLPSSSEIAGIPNERFSAFQDAVLHVSSVVPLQVIDISSTSYNSSETLSTKPVHLEPLQPAITILEEYPVEENVLMQSILRPSSQDSVSFPAGIVNHETVKKSCEPSESCYNSQLLGSKGDPVVAAPSQAFDASDTSYESKKQLIMPEETLESCETMKGLILDKLENAEDCFSSHSKLEENRILAGSPCTSSKDDGDKSNILESNQDAHMLAAMLDRPKIVDAHSPVSEHTGETMSSPEQLDNVVKSKSSLLARLQKKNPLIEAIASHDRSTLRKVPEASQSSRTVPSDERGVLLEQIRNRSFSLRQIKVEKQAAPQPVTNINVAAILEKANAIRQAFAGSDDEEDWSDG